MASELFQKLNARRAMVEAQADQFENEQTPSKSDCPRVSPRKPKAHQEQGELGSSPFPRVASPQRAPRRSLTTEFKDTMLKRRSLTDSQAASFDETPSKGNSVVTPDSTPSKNHAGVEAAQVSKPTAPSVKTQEKDESWVVASDHVDTLEDDQSPDMVIPEDPACKVYIGNLSYQTRFEALKIHMAKSGGVIAFAGILGEDGSVGGYGWSRGFGFVIYETPEEAKAAIEQMNGTELDGRTITVDSWSEENTNVEHPSKPRWSEGKVKSWKGKNWNNDDWYWDMFSQMAGYNWGYSRQRQNRSQRGDPKVRAWVGNVNYRADWKDLKSHMQPAGEVKWSEIMTRGGWQGTRSKGMGFVEYKTPEQVEEAVNSLNGTEMQGRQIVVDHWTTKKS